MVSGVGSGGAKRNGRWARGDYEWSPLEREAGQMEGGMSQRRKRAGWARPRIRERTCGQ